MNIAEHIKEHAALGLRTSSADFLSVGSGGRFATVNAAIEYVIANCPAPTRIYAGIGGTVAATKGSDLLTFTGLAELFNLPPDGITGAGLYPLTQAVWIDIDNENKLRLITSVVVDAGAPGASQVVMATGWNLADVTGKTFKLYTLPSFIIEIPPGNNVITSETSHSMVGLRANIGYVGYGSHISQLNFYATVAASETAIGFPDAGLTYCGNFKCLYSGNANRPWGADPSNEDSIAEALFGLSVVMENMIIESTEGSTLKDAIGLICAAIYATNLHIKTNAEAFVLHADSMIIDGIIAESKTGSVAGPSDFTYSWFQKTKKHQIHNVRYFNPVGLAPLRFGCVGSVVAGTATKEVFAENIRCGDLICSSVQTDVTDVMSFIGIRADTISTSKVSLITTGETANVSGQAALTVDSAANYSNLNPVGSVTDTPSAGAVTVNPNMAEVHYIAVTGALTVNAPSNPRDGQRLVLHYAADATPGRQITYNAVFKTSTVPVSTANAKAVHVFRYDAASWVQEGGPLVWL